MPTERWVSAILSLWQEWQWYYIVVPSRRYVVSVLDLSGAHLEQGSIRICSLKTGPLCIIFCMMCLSPQVECEYKCGAYRLQQRQLERHLSEACRLRPVVCSTRCGVSVVAEDYENHQARERETLLVWLIWARGRGNTVVVYNNSTFPFSSTF